MIIFGKSVDIMCRHKCVDSQLESFNNFEAKYRRHVIKGSVDSFPGTHIRVAYAPTSARESRPLKYGL